MKYAEQTSVPVERSKAEIEGLLARYGADQFVSGWSEGKAVIAFVASGRRVKFILPLPDPKADIFRYRLYKDKPVSHGQELSPAAQRERWEQACRQRWRALALVIKAKLEAVESGITSFEEEFYSHVVMPDGRTLYESTKEQVAIAYKTGKIPPLLEFR